MHLLCGDVEIEAEPAAGLPRADVSSTHERLTMLEQTVAALRTELDELKARLGD